MMTDHDKGDTLKEVDDVSLDTSRRTFLKASAGAATAAAVASQVSAGPVDPVRVGVVGTGSRGTDLIRKLNAIEAARVTAICDDYPPRLKAGRKYAGEQADTYSDYATMLDKADLDAIVIATPLFLHYPMSVSAIERGLAVFCEKTMCYSIDEARELAKLVEERDAIFQVGLQRRANAIYEQAEAMVETGMLGTVTAIKCQWHRNDDWRRDLPVDHAHPDYDALDRRLNWRLYRDSSQGLMAELGAHQMDVANRVLRTPPKRVMGMGGIDYYTDGREVFDNVFCTYEYDVPDAGDGKPGAVRATYSSIQTNAYEGVSELVMGTKGTLFLTQKKALFYVEGANRGVNTGAANSSGVDALSGATLRVSNDPWAHRGRPMEIDTKDDDTRSELVSFLRDVQSGNRKTVCDVRVGLENTATVLIANEAMRTGTTVTFPGDCKALRPS